MPHNLLVLKILAVSKVKINPPKRRFMSRLRGADECGESEKRYGLSALRNSPDEPERRTTTYSLCFDVRIGMPQPLTPEETIAVAPFPILRTP